MFLAGICSAPPGTNPRRHEHERNKTRNPVGTVRRDTGIWSIHSPDDLLSTVRQRERPMAWLPNHKEDHQTQASLFRLPHLVCWSDHRNTPNTPHVAIIRGRHHFSLRPRTPAYEDQTLRQIRRTRISRIVSGATQGVQVTPFAPAKRARTLSGSARYSALPAECRLSRIPRFPVFQIDRETDITQQMNKQQAKRSGARDQHHANIADQPWCPHRGLTVQCHHPKNPDRSGRLSSLPDVEFFYSTSSGILNETHVGLAILSVNRCTS